jgi:hypothetical protein
MKFPPLLGGDLNPLSGFCFPLFSMVFPWGFSIRVTICGKERNQNCSFLSSIYLQIFHVFWSLSAFPRGSEESQYNAVLRRTIHLRRQFRPARSGIDKRWRAPYRSTHPGHCWHRFTARAFVAGLATLDYGCAVLIERTISQNTSLAFRIWTFPMTCAASVGPAHGLGSAHSARVPAGTSKVSRMWYTARACCSRQKILTSYSTTWSLLLAISASRADRLSAMAIRGSIATPRSTDLKYLLQERPLSR